MTQMCGRPVFFPLKKWGPREFRTGVNVILHVSTTCVGFVSLSGQPGCVDGP
jgi:hypothetical protein